MTITLFYKGLMSYDHSHKSSSLSSCTFIYFITHNELTEDVFFRCKVPLDFKYLGHYIISNEN